MIPVYRQRWHKLNTVCYVVEMASFKSARDLLLVGVQEGLLDEEKPIIQTIFKNKLNAIETIKWRSKQSPVYTALKHYKYTK